MNGERDNPEGRHPDELLSLYADGELEREERHEVEDHLQECAECRAIVDDLEEVVARMDDLPGREPPRNYWPDIARAIGTEGSASQRTSGEKNENGTVTPLSRKEWRFSLPRLAAAAALVAGLAAGVTWSITRSEAGDSGAARVAATDSPATTSSGGSSSVRFAALGAGAESVNRLEEQYRKAREELDPSTRRMFDRNLELINRALEQARKELAEHPNNAYVQQHLTQIVSQKAQYLAMALQLTDTG